MSSQEPIDWTKVITDRPPPVRRQTRHTPPPEPEVFDLFGPEATADLPPRRETSRLAG